MFFKSEDSSPRPPPKHTRAVKTHQDTCTIRNVKGRPLGLRKMTRDGYNGPTQSSDECQKW